ncbi:hypothetical protein Q9R19_05300 [Microbacterium sp. ARD32]|uniref:hypothetical protein n=1 Tax=Microbacterium sp. ARD32 TaxID=2962577 RepID=UPI0028817E49|nr:hypothetical protein [Microbacterium sp. ARD32]MDT0157039.1 hypothetical protein [Microbacterium sp. ARD32]
MSTTLLADRRHTTSIHPPDTGDRQILSIPDHAAQRRLPLPDRLSLRIGLWLLERGLHHSDLADDGPRPRRSEGITEREALTLLTYDLHRGLR